MPLDASDRIRKLQELTIFGGYVATKKATNPTADVSTIAYKYQNISTVANVYSDYAFKAAIEKGKIHFSTSHVTKYDNK